MNCETRQINVYCMWRTENEKEKGKSQLTNGDISRMRRDQPGRSIAYTFGN